MPRGAARGGARAGVVAAAGVAGSAPSGGAVGRRVAPCRSGCGVMIWLRSCARVIRMAARIEGPAGQAAGPEVTRLGPCIQPSRPDPVPKRSASRSIAVRDHPGWRRSSPSMRACRRVPYRRSRRTGRLVMPVREAMLLARSACRIIRRTSLAEAAGGWRAGCGRCHDPYVGGRDARLSVPAGRPGSVPRDRGSARRVRDRSGGAAAGGLAGRCRVPGAVC